VLEGEYNANTMYMYVNRKMRPVETIPGMCGGVIKENLTMIYLICCKNFYK
jgi:hypothetical protein